MEFLKNYGKHRLCYVDGNKAYFTRIPMEKQWGDDWDDAPYEHNAGEPYVEHEHDVIAVYVETGNNCSELRTPCYGFTNSPYSVKSINNREVPWITYLIYSKLGSHSTNQLFAGIPLEEFAEIIWANNGIIYFPEEG